MLRALSIKNFALIETLDMDFSEGFSIITGETGAGKSILLGALGLLQGKRADLGSLKNNTEKCVIEGHFVIDKYDLNSLFEQLDIDYEPTTIIRREILPSGKSRAFVNDSPVNLSTLQELSMSLIDIHSQHQTQELSDESYQIAIIDAIAANSKLLIVYQEQLKLFKKNKSVLKSYIEEQVELLKEQDYNNFLLEELENAKLQNVSQEDLESEYEKLNNVEFVKEHFSHSWALLNGEHGGVIQSLKEAKAALQKTMSISKDYEGLFERISSSEIELVDIANEIEEQLERVVLDPEQLQLIHEQLQLIYNLQKKHQVNTVAELLVIEEGLSQKVFMATDLDDKIERMQKELVVQEEQLLIQCIAIREKRLEAIPKLQNQLIEILSLLGMPNATFKIELKDATAFTASGKDEVELLFSANKGMSFGLLKKVASGGELSRIMLAIKAILARYSNLPTIIFDEIDTGVSGEVADKMGDIMKEMSNRMQVFAITHLPQIASKGHQHYKVFKTSDDETTTSQLILLDRDSRIKEIAQMLSGKDITESALQHAEALLN
ncbi:DNA repair protein RecN [Myroides guanonis]|uniref:DNA repair protein RecN n=1 Tax=Myroides guanonis TaxID=1150112 RepID=A0A1I3NFG5_9FLAO|nr:DNA repair protein RecN [Myroides guanonis]SFJ07556.1 DNA replication and repair protein RecN [Myroides guanonis]